MNHIFKRYLITFICSVLYYLLTDIIYYCRYILSYKSTAYFKSALRGITAENKPLITNNNYENSNENKSKRQVYYGVVGASTFICLGLYKYYDIKKKLVSMKSSQATQVQLDVGVFRKDLPSYTMNDVAVHSTV